MKHNRLAIPDHPLTSRLWAQTWFEFRSTAMWFPVTYLPAVAVIAAFTSFTSTVQLDISDLPIAAVGFALAFAIGYLWERPNRVSSRFTSALPLSEASIAFARALSGALAVLLSLAGAVAILGVAFAARDWTGDPILSRHDALAYISSLAVASAPAWWITMGAGRITFLILAPGFMTYPIYATVLWAEVSETTFVTTVILTISATILGLGLLVRRRCGTPLPWALAAAPLVLLPALLYQAVTGHFPPEAVGGYVLPAAVAFASLSYARRANLMGNTTTAWVGVLFGISLALLMWLLPKQAYNASLVDTDSGGFVAAGMVVSLVWFALLARLHRSG